MEKEELIKECIKRLSILKLDKNIINEFEKNNKVYLSKIKTDITEVIANDEVNKLVELLEKDSTVKIYHIIRLNNKFFILCIHSHSNVWKEERTQLKRGFAEVLVGTLKDKALGQYEVKDIGIDVKNAKIKRVIEWKTA